MKGDKKEKMELEYTPSHLADKGFQYEKDLQGAGKYPFTRGIRPGMYREELWVMGQYSGFGSAEEANRRYRYLLEQGQTGFSIALDLPTQVGLDSNHPLSFGEVGKVGVAIDSLVDMEKLFDGISFHKVRQIRTTANAIGPLMAALLIAFADNQGIHPNDIRIFIQNDPLKEYIARGTYIFPPQAAVKLTVDVVEYCAQHLTNWVPLALSGYHIRESGGTAVQELAFSLANGVSYFEEALRRNLHIDSFAPKLFAFFTAHLDLLEEVGKFRAARRIWARMMQEVYGAENGDSKKLSILAYTAGGALTAQQPLNNIVRVTIEALAAVLGGVQTLATSSYDEAFSIPTEEAVTVALRTQQIIAHESGVTRTVDALGGSYALETLTSQIEEQVKDYMDRISQRGGAISCIEDGFFQQELAQESYRYQREVESGERVIVGVNSYETREEKEIPVFKSNPQTEKAQMNSLARVKEERDASQVKEALRDLKEAAKKDENIIPAAVAAVQAYATLGEMTAVLKEVYSEYQDAGIY